MSAIDIMFYASLGYLLGVLALLVLIALSMGAFHRRQQRDYDDRDAVAFRFDEVGRKRMHADRRP